MKFAREHHTKKVLVFVHAVIVEKKNDHCLALTEGNENPGQNDLMLWIDEDTEMYFFDEDMLRTLSREL